MISISNAFSMDPSVDVPMHRYDPESLLPGEGHVNIAVWLSSSPNSLKTKYSTKFKVVLEVQS